MVGLVLDGYDLVVCCTVVSTFLRDPSQLGPMTPARCSPAAVRDRIDAAVRKALAEPDVKARYETFAFESVGWAPAEIERQAALKSSSYGTLVQRKSISLD